MIIIKKIYIDNSSTSFPKAKNLGPAISDFIESGCYNISRGNYEDAYNVGNIVIETRMMLAKLFNYDKPKNVIFTSGITQSLNMVVKGLLKKGDHVITTTMEHNAVVRVLAQLEGEVEISYAQGDDFGFVEISKFEQLIKDNTKAIIVNHVSNINGIIQDIHSIGALTKKYNITFIVDCAQSAGHFVVDMNKDNIDVLTFTGHKGLLGPQGIGGFIIKDELIDLVKPVNVGGSGSLSDSKYMPDFTPDKYEAGTLNLPGIVGLNHALKFIDEVGIEVIHQKTLALAQKFAKEVNKIDGLILKNDFDNHNHDCVVSISATDYDLAQIAYLLDDEYGIMTRCGLQCAYMAHQTIGTYPQGTIRFSFGYFNDESDVEYAIESLRKIITELEE